MPSSGFGPNTNCFISANGLGCWSISDPLSEAPIASEISAVVGESTLLCVVILFEAYEDIGCAKWKLRCRNEYKTYRKSTDVVQILPGKPTRAMSLAPQSRSVVSVAAPTRFLLGVGRNVVRPKISPLLLAVKLHQIYLYRML